MADELSEKPLKISRVIICKKAREIRHNNCMDEGESVLYNFAERAPMLKGIENSEKEDLDIKDSDLEIERGQAGLP